MKQAGYSERRNFWAGRSLGLALQHWRVPLLVALPMAGIGLGILFWNQRTGIDTPYRYPFSSSSSGQVTQALEREIAFYQKRIHRSPEDGLDRAALAGAYLKLARATGDANRYLLAEQSAQRSLASLPFDNEGALLVLARIASARHDFSEAIRLAEQVLQSQPGSEEALSILITANLATGKLDQANRFANSLVNQIPTLGTLTQRALVEVAQGRDQAAIQDFQQALAVEEPEEMGSSAATRTQLGRFYFQRGNHTLARELYQEALRILPRYPLALINLAELEARQERYDAAKRHYAQVFVSPDYPTVYDHVALQGIAQVKDLQGDPSGAEELWNNAEALLRQHLNLSSFGHRRELARLLLARGRSEDLAEALSLMQAEVDVRRDAETLDTLAWGLSRLERWREARQILQEAIGQGTRHAGIFYRAGVIEQALGNRSQARAYFQLAQATDPTFDEQVQRTLGLGMGLSGLN